MTSTENIGHYDNACWLTPLLKDSVPRQSEQKAPVEASPKTEAENISELNKISTPAGLSTGSSSLYYHAPVIIIHDCGPP